MRAMVLKQLHSPLEWSELPDSQPGPGEIRAKLVAEQHHIFAKLTPRHKERIARAAGRRPPGSSIPGW